MNPNRFNVSPPPAPKRGFLKTIYRAFEGLAHLADRTEQRPPQSHLQSPFKDTVQFGVSCEATFMPSSFGDENYSVSFIPKGSGQTTSVTVAPDELTAFVKDKIADGATVHSITPGHDANLPAVSGRTRIYQSFKPFGLHVSEIVESTYGKSGMPDVTLYEVVPQTVSDLVLFTAFAGNHNCFPTAPDQGSGVNCSMFSANKLAWPTINGGIDLSLTFAIEKSILGRARTGLPAGYDPTPKRITVRIRANLTGDQLR